MDRHQKKTEQKIRRGIRTRARVRSLSSRARLSVFRSSRYISAQLIDDVAGKTLVAVSGKMFALKTPHTTKTAQAEAVGKEIASRAKALGVSRVVFDRGSYRYHGRVKALAEAARKGGLEY